jgi:predicted PhzF superfamily epimerase YddE/YHI9
MARLHVLNVFTDARGEHGNPLGVFAHGDQVPVAERQPIATALNFSETVFVDDPAAGDLHIYTPASEIPLAGHPLVGTAWLLFELGYETPALRPPAGEVPVWEGDGLVWFRASPEWAPPFQVERLGSPADVDAHPGPGPDALLYVWAWEDEEAGRIRSRSFPTEAGIEEDEATGSAAMLLISELGRPLTIRQGRGSMITARPGPEGTAEVGGRVVLDEERDWRIPPGAEP